MRSEADAGEAPHSAHCFQLYTGVQQAALDLEVLLQLALSRTRELDVRCSGLEGHCTRLEERHTADRKELQGTHKPACIEMQ